MNDRLAADHPVDRLAVGHPARAGLRSLPPPSVAPDDAAVRIRRLLRITRHAADLRNAADSVCDECGHVAACHAFAWDVAFAGVVQQAIFSNATCWAESVCYECDSATFVAVLRDV